MDISIVYFSGTGCTARCARELGRSLRRALRPSDTVSTLRIVERDGRIGIEGIDGDATSTPLPQRRPFISGQIADEALSFELSSSSAVDLLILMFPVHGFDAPAAVYKYLNGISFMSARRAAVVSVSGGGEMFPNRAARVGAIEALEGKGIRVDYEDMLCMPCNVIIPTPACVVRALLAALPSKCDAMAERLRAGEKRRVPPPMPDRKIAEVGMLSGNSKVRQAFARGITADSFCNGCGSCVGACPCSNIAMGAGDVPVFGDACAMCFACIYACPSLSLHPRTASFLMLKDGFSLPGDDAFARASLLDEERDSCLKEIRGPLWSGVRAYLEAT